MRTLTVAALALFAIPAFAEEPTTPPADDNDGKPEVQGPSTSDPDVKPEAPTPEIPNPAEDVRTYAGVGSGVAYGERGVGEFGGSAGLSLSTGTVNLSADPTLGYFLWDNIEGAIVLGVRHLAVEGESANQLSLLAEPSVHLPVTDGLFWFGAVGVGPALMDTSDIQMTAGLDLAPRTGVQVLLGRSGLLNLGARYQMVFSDVEGRVGPLQGQTLLAFSNTFDIQAGYTVMF
jgi:hypothetical protein